MKNTQPRSRIGIQNRRAGFAGVVLLGLLIVVGIILLIQFGPGGTAQKAVEVKRESEALVFDLNTRQFVILIAQHRESNRSLPKTLAEVDGMDPRMLKDQWENPIELSYGGESVGGKTIAVFKSAGRDGMKGTEDDIEVREELPF